MVLQLSLSGRTVVYKATTAGYAALNEGCSEFGSKPSCWKKITDIALSPIAGRYLED